ncbi:O-antigen ligase family protein [Lacinutrix venerupis]|uniref:O-antigen ligase-related domain-containing protein n=1 Tax=Lacinutrix venerupis TaxID=1486034 RepID=A0AAC9LL83_9FLAO|nr:O-antigen ligase family protein [Lacinutrix venerupis]APX98902.1 hypothetical protein BWR22_00800 [Lacinutrix venerupis]
MHLLKHNIQRDTLQSMLLVMYAFFMPLSLFLNANTVILILLVLIFIADVYNKRAIKFKTTFSLVVYFIILVCSLIYTKALDFGIETVIKSITLTLFPLALSTTSFVSEKQLKSIAIGFFVGNMVVFIISIIYAIGVYKINPLPLREGFSYFTNYVDIHSSYYSIYLIFSTALIFWAFRKDKRFNLFIKIGLVIAIVLMQLYLKSRAGLLSTAALIFIYVILNYRKRIIIFSALGLVVFIFLFNNLDFLNRNLNESTNDRFSVWSSAKDVIVNKPIFGVGIGDYQYELDKQYYLNLFNHGIDDKLNSHNQFLETTVATGIIGLIAFLAIFYFLMKRYFETKSHIILYFVIPTIILMMFDSVLLRQHGIYFFAFFTTLLLKYKPE